MSSFAQQQVPQRLDERRRRVPPAGTPRRSPRCRRRRRSAGRPWARPAAACAAAPAASRTASKASSCARGSSISSRVASRRAGGRTVAREVALGPGAVPVSTLMDDLRIAVGGDAGDLRLEFRRDLHARQNARDETAQLPWPRRRPRSWVFSNSSAGPGSRSCSSCTWRLVFLGERHRRSAVAAGRRGAGAAAGRAADQPRTVPPSARRRPPRGRRLGRGRELRHAAGDRVDRAIFALFSASLYCACKASSSDVMLGVELHHVAAGQVPAGCASTSAGSSTRCMIVAATLSSLTGACRRRSTRRTASCLPRSAGEVDVLGTPERRRPRPSGGGIACGTAPSVRAKSAGVIGTSSSLVAPSASTYSMVPIAQSLSGSGLPSSEKRSCRVAPRRGSCTNTGLMRLSTASRPCRLACGSAMPCSPWQGV